MLEELEKITDEKVRQEISSWLEGPYDETTKKTILRLLKDDPNLLYDAFYQSLSFGTGGMRGLMDVGTNRMNLYTIRAATQGLANYILSSQNIKKKPSVVIGYDSRNHSQEFAQNAAAVLSANGIDVYTFHQIRPTPLISFSIRAMKATAGIMITASHNPPQYNGYKVYWSDGAQVLPPHDNGIIQEVRKIKDPSQIKTTPNKEKIHYFDEKIDQNYLKHLKTIFLFPKDNEQKGKDLCIVYTNLHGTGITLFPPAMQQAGFTNLHIVEQQKSLDGNFPFAPKPNPEEKQTLQLGINLMKKIGGDLFIATDPDADRMAAVVKSKKGPVILTGNQIASILLYHLCHNLSQNNQLDEKAAFVKSIVTTNLFDKIANNYHRKCFHVLTGFKYIGQIIHQWEKEKDGYNYLFGAEESYGYLIKSFARDKDAISSGCLLAEAALQAKIHHMTLYDLLLSIYKQFGVYREKLHSIAFEESSKGMKRMQGVMTKLRTQSPKLIGNCEIIRIDDYLEKITLDTKTKKTSPLSLPKSNVLAFHLSDESTLIIRPSGTEPKIKIYVFVCEQNIDDNIENTIQLCDERILSLIDSFLQLIKN